MGNLFNMDNPLFSTLGKIYDLLFLSVLWLIFCIPIITMGPATTAMYYAVVKVIRRERGYLFREFFKSFKQNFKKGSIIGTLVMVILVILAFDLLSAYKMMTAEYNRGTIFMGIYIGITCITISFAIYVFPILSRFEMTLKQLIKTTIFMSVRHLLSTVIMVVIFVVSLVLTVYFTPILFILPGLVTFLHSLFMEKIFKKYMPESKGPGEETGQDEWYLE